MPADDLIVTYRVQADGAAIDERAEALLLEQTVELPRSALHDAEAAARVLGHVVSIDRIGDTEHRLTLGEARDGTRRDQGRRVGPVGTQAALEVDEAERIFESDDRACACA